MQTSSGDAAMPSHPPRVRAEIQLRALEQLLGIAGNGLRATVDEAATLLAEAFLADKVDAFLYDPATDTLVAAGTSRTPMGRRQQALGLDRLPLSNGGLTVRVFQSGEPHRTGHADMDPEELRAIVEELGVRSELLVPLSCVTGHRGVLQVDSATPDRFDAEDMALAIAAARWVGLILDRVELTERATAEAERRGRRAAGEELTRLTAREQEVVVLVAEGLTNAEIAHRLVLEEGTVANHVRRVLLKLDMRSRTQLAVWAVERGLYRSDRDHDAARGVLRPDGRAAD
jgi:two-component system OmpR family sensor kinase